MSISRSEFLKISSATVGCLIGAPLIAQLTHNDDAVSILDALPRDLASSVRDGTCQNDLTPYVRRAIEDAPGRTLSFPAGRYTFDSSSLTQIGLRLLSKTRVRGVGEGTQLVVTGDRPCTLFRPAVDASDIAVSNLSAIGNNVQGGSNNGGFFACVLDAETASRDVENIIIEDCSIDNFAAATVVLFEHLGRAKTSASRTYDDRFAMRNIGTRRNRYISRKGNIDRAGQIGATSCFIEFNGYGGPILDAVINDHTMRARYIKQGVMIFGDVDRITVAVREISEAGFEAAGVDAAAYGLLLYAWSHLKPEQCPRNAQLNLGIVSAWSCGIYLQGARHVTGTADLITGQSDEGDASIPKAAVALNGANDITLTITAHTNRQSLVVAAPGAHLEPAARASTGISITMASQNAANAHVVLRPLSSLGDAGGIKLRGSLSGSGHGVVLWETADTNHGLVNVDVDMTIDVAGDAIRAATSYATPLHNSRFAGIWVAGGMLWRTNDGRNLKGILIEPVDRARRGKAAFLLTNTSAVMLLPTFPPAVRPNR